ncbi:MAG: polysaccharide biosynthesis/export family protein [Candidatus Omnitrophica bacterium]|nr:polysaccharide biosynthesis/export family protein [Candidatus Omnitrophota bacterium]
MNKKIFLVFFILLFDVSLLLSAQTAKGIRPGQEFDIKVENEPYLNTRVKVSEDGTIYFRNLERVNVEGMDSAALEEKILGLIEKYYTFIDNPKVSINIEGEEKQPAISDEVKKDFLIREEAGLSLRVPGAELNKELKPTYRLSPHDVLDISVYGENDLDRTVRISEQGTINYPLIGEVGLKGLTIEEAADKIESMLKEGFFVNPQVSIMIKEYSKFSVLGEVNGPGTFELKGALTLVDALVLAEGPKDNANLKQIKIIRTSADKTDEVKEYIVDFETEGSTFYLNPLDRVVVEPKGKIYILGAVASPGMYYITEKEMVLSDAISFLAGGLNEEADSTAIEIVRKQENKDKTFVVDLEKQGQSFLLYEQDRIIIKEYGSISVFGQVAQPGRYPFKEGLTAVDAVALAGGFTDVASTNNVKVIRKEQGKDRAIKVPVGYILKSGDTSRDVVLRDGDTVVVPESWF